MQGGHQRAQNQAARPCPAARPAPRCWRSVDAWKHEIGRRNATADRRNGIAVVTEPDDVQAKSGRLARRPRWPRATWGRLSGSAGSGIAAAGSPAAAACAREGRLRASRTPRTRITSAQASAMTWMVGATSLAAAASVVCEPTNSARPEKQEIRDGAGCAQLDVESRIAPAPPSQHADGNSADSATSMAGRRS